MSGQEDSPRRLAESPFGSMLGIEYVSSGEGRAHCRLLLTQAHRNTGGRIHGGVLAALADTAAGLAVRSVRPEGSQSATTDLSIAFLRPPQGETLEARAEVYQSGRRLLRAEIDLRSGDKLIARAQATFMLIW